MVNDPEQAVRDAVRADRENRGITWEQLAGELGVPVSRIHEYCSGVTQVAGSRLRAAIANKYPELLPVLTESSLSWMHRHQATAVLPSPDQPQEAPR